MPKLSQRRAASPTLVLVIVCAGVVLASLDLFIVNVALPQMARDFGVHGLGDLSWVLNAYAIVYAALLVLFGRLADRYRRDRGFMVGVAVFVAASAACAAAASLPSLPRLRCPQRYPRRPGEHAGCPSPSTIRCHSDTSTPLWLSHSRQMY